jgi:hypothetical protein
MKVIAKDAIGKLIENKEYEVTEILDDKIYYIKLEEQELGWYFKKHFKEVSNEQKTNCN